MEGLTALLGGATGQHAKFVKVVTQKEKNPLLLINLKILTKKIKNKLNKKG